MGRGEKCSTFTACKHFLLRVLCLCVSSTLPHPHPRYTAPPPPPPPLVLYVLQLSSWLPPPSCYPPTPNTLNRGGADLGLPTGHQDKAPLPPVLSLLSHPWARHLRPGEGLETPQKIQELGWVNILLFFLNYLPFTFWAKRYFRST